MNTSETPIAVVKGDLDSVIMNGKEGPFGDSIWILGILLAAKILFIASLAGLYYLFSWNPTVGFFSLVLLVGLVILWMQKPWKVTEVPTIEHAINPHAQRAARYEAEGNTAMAEHTRRIHNL